MADFLLKDTESKAQVKRWLESSLVAYGSGADAKWADEDTLCEHFFNSLSGTAYRKGSLGQGTESQAPWIRAWE